MSASAAWHGRPDEGSALLSAVARHCTCRFNELRACKNTTSGVGGFRSSGAWRRVRASLRTVKRLRYAG